MRSRDRPSGKPGARSVPPDVAGAASLPGKMVPASTGVDLAVPAADVRGMPAMSATSTAPVPAAALRLCLRRSGERGRR